MPIDYGKKTPITSEQVVDDLDTLDGGLLSRWSLEPKTASFVSTLKSDLKDVKIAVSMASLKLTTSELPQPNEDSNVINDFIFQTDKKQIISPDLSIVAPELPKIIKLSDGAENLAESLNNLESLERRKARLIETLTKQVREDYLSRKLGEIKDKFEVENRLNIVEVITKIKSLEAIPFIDKTPATGQELAYYRNTKKKFDESIEGMRDLIKKSIRDLASELQQISMQIVAIEKDQRDSMNERHQNN